MVRREVALVNFHPDLSLRVNKVLRLEGKRREVYLFVVVGVVVREEQLCS